MNFYGYWDFKNLAYRHVTQNLKAVEVTPQWLVNGYVWIEQVL